VDQRPSSGERAARSAARTTSRSGTPALIAARLQSSYSGEKSARPSACDAALLAVEQQAVALTGAHADRGRLREEHARERQAIRGLRQHPHPEARAVLLHLQVMDGDVEGARLEEPLHQVVEVLGDEVVQVRLQSDDAVRGDAPAAPEDRPQHVGHRPGTVVSRAVADRLDRHGGQSAELVDHAAQDRRSGGRDRLPLHVGRDGGDAAQQLEGRRRRQR
jgi:hypothetical protein